MDLLRTTRPGVLVGPFPPLYGGLNPPSPSSRNRDQHCPSPDQFPDWPDVAWDLTEVPAPAFGPPLHPYTNLSHVGRGHQKSQGQAIALSQQMDRAAFAFPAIGDTLSLSEPGQRSRNMCYATGDYAF
jgi:hypothetical protein